MTALLDEQPTLFDDLEGEMAPACDVYKLREDNPDIRWPVCSGESARWVARRACCGGVVLLCDSCKDYYQARANEGWSWFCVRCNCVNTGYSSYEPL